MKVPKWSTLANISRGPSDLNLIEIIDLKEKIVPCFLVDEYHYKLIVKVKGDKKVVQFTSMGPLRLQEFDKLLKEALDGLTISQLMKKGYDIILRENFTCSPARIRILNDVKRPKKERRFS